MAVFSTLLPASPFQLGAFDALLGALCFVIIASLVVFILVAVWVYRDAEARGMSGGLWVVLLVVASFFTFIGGLIVLIIYLIVRAEHPQMYGVAPYAAYAPMYPPPAPATPPPPGVAPPVAGTAGATTCRNCGAPLGPGVAFCGRCGARV